MSRSASSADHDGYLIYSGGQLQVFGGTSVAAPSFAGIVTLLNQYLVSSGVQSSPGVGNFNAQLYPLAQSASSAFHDITTGNNIVTVACSSRSPNCSETPIGYSAGVGYDQVTGLGSVDVDIFIGAYSGKTVTSARPVTSMTLVASPTSITANGTVNLTAAVTSSDGTTPTGTVAFTEGALSLGSAVLSGSAGTATATLAVSGTSCRKARQSSQPNTTARRIQPLQ